MTTKPRLTKHQFEVYSRIVRAAESRKAVATSVRVAAFSSRRLPNRVFHNLAQLRRDGGPAVGVSIMGNAGALQHLEEKGYLRILVPDSTTPVYVLADDEPVEPKLVREYFARTCQLASGGATTDGGRHDHPTVFQVFMSTGWTNYAAIEREPVTTELLRRLKTEGVIVVALMTRNPYRVADFTIEEILRAERSAS